MTDATQTIQFPLTTEERMALRRVANKLGAPIEAAAAAALRDWLIGHGFLEPEHELDEDTETVGEA